MDHSDRICRVTLASKSQRGARDLVSGFCDTCNTLCEGGARSRLSAGPPLGLVWAQMSVAATIAFPISRISHSAHPAQSDRKIIHENVIRKVHCWNLELSTINLDKLFQI